MGWNPAPHLNSRYEFDRRNGVWYRRRTGSNDPWLTNDSILTGSPPEPGRPDRALEPKIVTQSVSLITWKKP